MFFKIYFSRRKFEQDAAALVQKQNGWTAGAYCGARILSASPDEQYTGNVNMAGLYSPEDFTGEYDNVPVVKMRKDLVKHYCKKYDSVLVDRDEFVNFISDLKTVKSKKALH